jgi:hypothetical protein
MSDSFEMLVDIDATPSEADAVAGAVLDRFRELGLITGEANSDCVLGGIGYRPGSAVAELYELGEREGKFWELVTCGVEPAIGRSLNMWALGPVCEEFSCAACGVKIEPLSDALDEIAKAIVEWQEESGPALVACPKCQQKYAVTQWQCKPPLGFGNLSFRFWNWPPLDLRSWKIDIPELVREVTGHTVVQTYGHL